MLKITKNQGSIQVTADKSGFYPFDGTITFPTNSLFTATSANTDMITFKSTSNGDVQFVGNYKDITISGRSYDTKQKFLTAFSNLANQGSVDAYTKAETDAKLNDKLTARTNANGALFISSSSNDDANSSVALYNSIVKGSNDVAIQLASTPDKEGMHNLAILNMAQANGIQNIAIGAFQRCKGISNIGIGVGASDPNTVDVNGQGNVCIGASSQAHTASNNAVNLSVAIGYNAKASSNYCTVIGNSANSKSSHAVAVGDGAYVEHDCDSSVAVGNSAMAYGKNSVAIGCTSYATDDKPLDICCGKKDNNEVLSVLQSDATGKISVLKGDGTDTRIVIQDEIEALKNAGGSGGTVDGLVIDGYKVAAGLEQTFGNNNLTNLVTIGNKAKAYGDNSVVIGQEAWGYEIGSTVIGHGATCLKEKSIAIGYNSRASEQGSIAIGASSQCLNSSGNISIGYMTTCHYPYGVAIGYQAISETLNGISIGYLARTNYQTPLVINAGFKTVNGSAQPLTVLQSDSTGKLSILKGDGTDERIVIQDALSAGGGGTVDAYTKAETDTKLEAKQDKLTAGTGITIDENNVISSTGGSGGAVDGLVIEANKVAAGFDQTFATDRTNFIVIGDRAEAQKDSLIVIGREAKAMGNDCVVIGHMSESTVNRSAGSVVIGNNSKSSARYGLSIGQYAEANDTTPLVIKAGVNNHFQPLTMIQADENGKISLLKGDGTNKRMVIQDEIEALKNAGGGSANPLVNVKGTDSATITDTVTDAVAIGSGAKVTEELSVAIGAANALSGHCVAIGGGANATKMSSVAIGDGACATAHMFDVAIGFHAATTDTKPLEINAGYKTVGGATTPLTVLQSDSNGKISVLLGDGTDTRIVISDEITALKAEITTLKAEIAALKGGASTGA